MSERLTVFSNTGEALTTLRAAVKRSWVLGGIGQAQFQIAYTDPKCLQEYLEFGNYVLIQHETLPDWIGVIDTPRQWGVNAVTVNAYEVPMLWEWRVMPLKTTLNGTAGSIFEQLITLANDEGDTRIVPGSIYGDGVDRQEKLSDTAYQHIMNVRYRSGNDYKFRPTIQDRLLTIYADWVEYVGERPLVMLSEGHNIEANENLLTEDGDIINDIYAYGDNTTSGTRLAARVFDDTSISRYGLRQKSQTFAGNTLLTTLTSNATSFVNNNKDPQRILRVRALNIGDTFSALRLGNVLNLTMQSVGFVRGQRGFSSDVRIYGISYNSGEGIAELIVKEVNPND